MYLCLRRAYIHPSLSIFPLVAYNSMSNLDFDFAKAYGIYSYWQYQPAVQTPTI